MTEETMALLMRLIVESRVREQGGVWNKWEEEEEEVRKREREDGGDGESQERKKGEKGRQGRIDGLCLALGLVSNLVETVEAVKDAMRSTCESCCLASGSILLTVLTRCFRSRFVDLSR